MSVPKHSCARLLPWLLIASTGCGRISFDARSDAGGTDTATVDTMTSTLPLCFEDTFDDGDASDWMTSGQWSVVPIGVGDSALHNDTDSPVGATHPMLAAITEAIVVVDINIEIPTVGDFFLHFMEPGWTDPSNDSKYRVALYAQGSDNADDNIRRVIAPVNTNLAQTPAVLAGNTFQNVKVTLRSDHVVEVVLEGNLHLTSPADSGLAGPFDIVFDFFRPGSIDNVKVYCARS